MSETLYTLTDKLRLIQRHLEEAEDLDDLKELLQDTEEALSLSIDDKLEGMMTIRQNKLARVEALEAEAKRLKELAKSEQIQIKRLEEYAEFELKKLGYSYNAKDKKRAVGKFTVGFKKLPPKLEILDESKIPMQYMNIPPMPQATPDKAELLKVLKQKAEFKHGKKWTKEIEEMEIEEFGVKLINNNQSFEVK